MRRVAKAARLAGALGIGGAVLLAAAGTSVAQDRPLSSPAAMNATLDSLERVALTAPDATEQARAALSITGVGRIPIEQPGDRNAPVMPMYPGVVARLDRIYAQSTNPSVRRIIVDWMPAQTERSEAAAFLGKVASEAPAPIPPSSRYTLGNDTEFSRQHRAVYKLSVMGAVGRAELERLHAAGSVRDPSAKAYLEKLAKDGYRVKNH